MEMGESEVLWNRSDRCMDDPIGSWDDHGNGVAGIMDHNYSGSFPNIPDLKYQQENGTESCRNKI